MDDQCPCGQLRVSLSESEAESPIGMALAGECDGCLFAEDAAAHRTRASALYNLIQVARLEQKHGTLLDRLDPDAKYRDASVRQLLRSCWTLVAGAEVQWPGPPMEPFVLLAGVYSAAAVKDGLAALSLDDEDLFGLSVELLRHAEVMSTVDLLIWTWQGSDQSYNGSQVKKAFATHESVVTRLICGELSPADMTPSERLDLVDLSKDEARLNPLAVLAAAHSLIVVREFVANAKGSGLRPVPDAIAAQAALLFGFAVLFKKWTDEAELRNEHEHGDGEEEAAGSSPDGEGDAWRKEAGLGDVDDWRRAAGLGDVDDWKKGLSGDDDE